MKILNLKNKLFILLILQITITQNVICQTNNQILFPKQKIFNVNFKVEDFNYWYRDLVNDNLFNYKIENEIIDDLGFKHIKINQYYNDIKIENATYILHTKNNNIESVNGYLYKCKPLNKEPIVSENRILRRLKTKGVLTNKEIQNPINLSKKYINIL